MACVSPLEQFLKDRELLQDQQASPAGLEVRQTTSTKGVSADLKAAEMQRRQLEEVATREREREAREAAERLAEDVRRAREEREVATFLKSKGFSGVRTG